MSRMMTKILHHIHKLPKVTKAVNIFIRSSTLYGNKITELNEKTLTGRLLTYLNKILSNQNGQILDVKQTVNLKYYNIERIKASIKNLNVDQTLNNVNLLRTIDKECSKLVNKMKTSEILEILYNFMKVVPSRIIKCTFYEFALKELSSRIDDFNKHEIIALLFYIGLKKKKTHHHDVIRKCINYLSGSYIGLLTIQDFCIICNSAFKTSTRITNEEFLSQIVKYFYDYLQLSNDPAFFITILKTIRQNRFQDEELLATLSCTIFFNNTLQYYSISALCHILAVYSDYLYYDENILRVFTEKCISMLKESKFVSKDEYLQTHARLKDIKRLLWCLSNLNYYKIETNDIKYIIIPNILKRVEAGDIENNFSSLIEITLYLWMFNYHAYELLPYFLHKSNVQQINQLNTPIKQRLNLLLTCIFYEEKTLLKDLNYYPRTNYEYNMTHQLDKRPLLQRIINNVKDISKKHEINRFEVNCQIPGINIIGLTGYKRNIYKIVHIEVLDEYTTLKNSKELPSGLMQLKLRLLENLEEALILIVEGYIPRKIKTSSTKK